MTTGGYVLPLAVIKNMNTKFYADENIESWLVELLRNEGFNVIYSHELGFVPRDDKFHFQYAKKKNLIILSHDKDFLNDRDFPFREMKNTGVVIINTELGKSDLNVGYAVNTLIEEIGKSGVKNLFGLKIQIDGPIIKLKGRIKGRILTDKYDSRLQNNRNLFEK